MDIQLLTTKLYIPQLRSNLVPRPNLLQQLDNGLQQGHRLTLISAPAGFGKTTLLSDWVTNSDRLVAWLSLDKEDSDPARFYAYLIAALQTIVPTLGQTALEMLQNPQPSPMEAILTALINDLACIPDAFMLILDDYHLITTLSIHQALAFLLDHMPPQMHIVIATREDPLLPFSRLRARGQMTEIRQANLQFSTEETAEFLWRTRQLALSTDIITVLQKHTEGWAAGLQLVALSIDSNEDAEHFSQSFDGSHRYILDYLIEEVYQQQSPEARAFLMKTAILDRFTAPLCDAVTGQENSHEMLLNLERANLFIIPLDKSRHWYRYHRLFADLLRHRLDIRSPEDKIQLHKRAGQWYRDNGLPTDAMRHVLAASDWETAKVLIPELSGAMLKRGEVMTLLGWCQAIPEEIILANPSLCLEYSWPLILTEQIDMAETYLKQAKQAADAHGDSAMAGAIIAANVHIARMRGENQRAVQLSEQALALLPTEDHASRSVVALNLGMAQWFRGKLTEAQQTLAQAEIAGRGSGNTYAQCAALAFLGRTKTAQGQSSQAVRYYEQIIEVGRQSPIVAVGHYDLARLAYEWNDLETAVKHLEQGIELSQRNHAAEFTVGGFATLAYVKQAQGDSAAARYALQQTGPLLEQADISPSTHLRVLSARILVALGQGDLDAAAFAAGQAPRPEASGSFPDYLSLMLAQASTLLAQKKQEIATQVLATLHGMAYGTGWQSVAFQARALQALAEPSPARAFDYLTQALTWTEKENYIRTYVDAGEPMKALLGKVDKQSPVSNYAVKLLAAFEPVKTEHPDTHTVIPHAQTLIEPLSDRELEILSLLDHGQTNSDIANTLYISINTVKTHLKNIYGKLDVNDRRQAAVRAKKLGLI